MPVSMGAIFPFAASRILFNAEDTGRGGGGEGEGEGDARFPPTWFLFPLGRGQARYPPEEKRRQGGGRTRDSTRIDTIFLSLLLFFSSSPRIEGYTLRCVFQLLGSSNLRGGGRRTVTSRSYRVSSVSWS